MKKLILLLIFACPFFTSSQNIDVFRQFNGRYDFTAIGNTLSVGENNNGFCSMLDQCSANFTLGPGRTLVSAQLYWASIGTGDFDVAINGTPISAERTFSHVYNGQSYFGAQADVTDLVAATGDGTYTFSDMDVSAILGNYCGTNFGGFAIYVIYEDPSLLLNQISLFDGLESVSSVAFPLSITLQGIDVTSDDFSKIGFLAWEGDQTLAVSESLRINGILISNPPLNPANNAFNSTNSYTNSPVSYQMDLDFYDLENIVQPGDTSVLIELTSGQDYIMMNNIITSVNSELPDATIVIDNLGLLCENGDIDVEYTVFNLNSTNELPPNTPIAFYADDGVNPRTLLGQTFTVNEIAIGGSESGTATLSLPPALPNNFDLIAVVDDIGSGMVPPQGNVSETDETNNEFILPIDKSNQILIIDPGPACLGAPVILDSELSDPPYTIIKWFRNGFEIPGETDTTLIVTVNGIYTVQAFNGACEVNSFSNPVVITFRPQPVANPAPDMFQCDFGNTNGTFILTDNNDEILGAQNPADFDIDYYETEELAIAGVPGTEIPAGVKLIDLPSPERVWARIEDSASGTCFDITFFDIYFSRAIAGTLPLTVNYCDTNGDGEEIIDLEAEFNPTILDGQPSSDYNITYHLSQADADGDTGALAIPHTVLAPSQQIFVRLENRDDATCVDTTQNVTIILDSPPTVNTTPPNLVMCDDNNDGFATFDLSLQTGVITFNDPALTVSYHETLVNAESNSLPLANFYINDQRYLDAPIIDPLDINYGTGGVWARVSRAGNSCVSIVPFALEVRFSPVGTTPEPLRLCDDAVADGITRFDLTVVRDEVLGTLDPLGFDLYYYEDLNQAIIAGDLAITPTPNFSQAIPDPTNYFNTNDPYNDTIYILIVSNAGGTIPPNPNSAEGCYDIVELELFVDPLPQDFGPFEMELCDDELQGSTLTDEISTFDLTSINPDVTNGFPYTVIWFLNYADEAADLPIPNPTTFQNTATPQTVIGRVSSEFGCVTLVELTLRVLPNPNPNTTPDPLELCDDDDDGIVDGWDPSLADVDIINGEANVSVTYYETEALALAGNPATQILFPYTNIDPFSQIIFARVEKDVPPATIACFTIVELELRVIALPEKPKMPPFKDPFIACDESGSGTGIFNLTLQNEGVLGDQNPADFVTPIKYYDTSFADALAGLPGTEIATPQAYLSAAGVTIWVRLESAITGCVRVTPFQLALELFPTIGAGADLTLCDDMVNGSTDTDGISTFDLTLNEDLITLGNTDLEVFYYATPIDQANNNPIINPTAYQNIFIPQQRIYVTAFSELGCRATNSFLIIVQPGPAAFSPGVVIACDTDNDGYALFELSDQTDFITGGVGTLTVTYHSTLLNAQNGIPLASTLYENDEQYLDAPITDPLNPLYGTGGVWVRVQNDPAVNTCFRILSFALEVHTSPVATVPEPLRECDDEPIDGVTEFDLTEVEPEVLGTLDPNGYDLYYYLNLADAQLAGDLALTAPDFSLAIGAPSIHRNTASPFTQTIYILVVGNANSSTPPNPNGGEGCYDIVELQLIVDPIPGNNGPLSMMSCDDELQGSTSTDRISTFDLTTNDFIITGGNGNLTVSWFDALGNPILNPQTYQNINTPQTVIGTVSSQFGCSNNVLVTLTVLPNPTPNMNPEPYVLCDDDDDGIMEFDLTTKTLEIQGIEDNVTITYYETLQAAIDAAPGTAIVGLYSNTTPYNQFVYARVTNNVPPELLPCYTIVPLELIVVPLPDAPDANFQEEIVLCDDDNDDMAIFDLLSQNPSVYGVQDPADFEPIAYYENEADANDGNANFIDPAILGAYESITRSIWVRLESLATGCARVTRFELIVGEFPGSGIANDLVLCDDEESGSTTDGFSIFNLTVNTPIITGNDPTLTVVYYASLDDLNNNIPIATPAAYQNVDSPQQEIFVSILGQNFCSNNLSFFITVNPNPQPVQPTPLVACDVDGDGFTSFDLETKTLEIQGIDPALIITYHETLLDAETGNFPLASPYENIFAFNQTLYVRAAYNNPPSGTGCYTVVTLELVVNPSPVVPQDLEDLIACDDDDFAEFDLTVHEEIILLANPNLTDVTITYYLSEAAALLGTPFIIQPEIFLNTTNPQTIWVRLDDNLTECFAIGQFDLIVNNGLPIIDPTPLVLCDDLGEDNDGITTFDLTVKNNEITNGVLTQGVSYFLTEEDAQNNENRINPETAYVNSDVDGNPINPQILFVRVEDSNSSCISYTTLTIRVVPNPIPTDPDPIELCDYTEIVGPGDELEIFDLTIRESQILNGNNWTIGYYESYDNAVNDVDPIPPLEAIAYQNISNPQIIYVRTTNPNSLCFEIVELELIVNPIPDDTAIVTPLIGCAFDGSEIAVFNLETKVDEILAGQPQPPFEVTFYLNEIDAANQENRIVGTTTFQNTTNPQTIYTGILNSETGCYIGGVQSFELIVQPGAIAVTPEEPFIICDNLAPSDGFAEFNLEDVTNQQVSDLRAEILGGQDPSIFLLTFHETMEEAEAGTNAIVFPYVNIINPQVIYVRVTNDLNEEEPKCNAIVELILKVEQLPDVVLDDEYRLCVDENGNPIPEVDGSPSPPVIDTGLDPALYTFQWDLDGVFIVGETGPSIIALQGGVYTVLITELSSGCEITASATVIVSSPPFTYEANLVNGAFAGNHTIEVIAEGEGTYEYQLDDGPFQDSNIFENVEPGNHTITIRDKFGCGSVTFDVGVIDYPLYFTPNGDGYHETWNIIGIAAGDPTAKIYIFDRFGKLLKQISPLGEGWDGTYGGNPLPSSDYWFRIEYTEDEKSKEFKGHFTLKR